MPSVNNAVNAVGMSFQHSISVVRHKSWHNVHQLLLSLAWLVAVCVHIFELYHYYATYVPVSHSGSNKNMTECEYFRMVHEIPPNNNSDSKMHSSLTIVSYVALAVQVVSGICLFLKHNFDSMVVLPIVKTPEVVLLVCSGLLLIVLSIFLRLHQGPTMFALSWNFMLFVEILLAVAFDSAVALKYEFELFHLLSLVLVLGVDLLTTVLFPVQDYLLLCLGADKTVVVSSFIIQRIIYVNLITSLFPSLIVVCTNNERTQMRFAEVPVERMDYASLIAEGENGEGARKMLLWMTTRNIVLREKLKHVQKSLFLNEFGGSSTKTSYEKVNEERTDSFLGASSFGLWAGNEEGKKTAEMEQPLLME